VARSHPGDILKPLEGLYCDLYTTIPGFGRHVTRNLLTCGASVLAFTVWR